MLEKENSDKPAREKRQDEWRKIKSLGWKERLVYFWDYYKIVIVIVAAVIVAVQSGISIWKNMHTEELLNVVFLNSGYFPSEEDGIRENFEEYLGGLEKNQTITLDFSMSLHPDNVDNMSIAAQTKIAALVMDGSLDAMVLQKDLYDHYAAQDLYDGLDDWLTSQEKEEWADRFLTEHLDGQESITAVRISDTPLILKNEMYRDGEAYLAVPVGSGRKEMAVEFLRFLLEDKRTQIWTESQ